MGMAAPTPDTSLPAEPASARTPVSGDAALTRRARVIGTELLSAADFATALRQRAASRYHNHHPFHQLLHSGRLTRAQVRAWALNRTYYQAMIPVKDAIILSRLTAPADRRQWVGRLTDHDGSGPEDGSMERWLKLTDALGLDRDLVLSGEAALPATRFAVDASVGFVSSRPVLEGIAAALTEIFAASITEERLAGMLSGYDFIRPDAMTYFARRLTEPNRRADFSLDYVTRHALTPADQVRALAAVTFKCDVLWAMLDALTHAYVDPAAPPPGAPSFVDP